MSDVVYKHAVTFPISREMFDDAAAIRPAMDAMWRRFTHPWEFPDKNPMPRFTPCPRLHALMERYEAARARWADIVYVARYGLPEPRED